MEIGDKTGDKPKHRTSDQRREVVERWKVSGLTQAEFCRKEGVPVWALSNWKRKLANPRAKNKVRPRNNHPRSELDWRELIAKCADSGLSDSEFCKQKNVNVKVFRKWRKFLGNSTQSENPFVQVKFDTTSSVVAKSSIEIVLPGGSKISVTDETPMDLLAKVIRTLEEKC